MKKESEPNELKPEAEMEESGPRTDDLGRRYLDEIREDFKDLRFKYAEVGNLVDRFGFEFKRGKIKVPPQDLMDSDNPHEQAFLRWVGKPSVMRGLGVDQVRTIIEIGAKGETLKSKSKDIMAPQAMNPIPKKAKPKKID